MEYIVVGGAILAILFVAYFIFVLASGERKD